MKLRDHPLLRYRGIPSWPPVWTQKRADTVRTLRGEVGTLQYVHARPDLSSQCFLVIDYEGESYVGCLLMENNGAARTLARIFTSNLKRSIKDIGDLEVSETL
jgi:hypothetical protein